MSEFKVNDRVTIVGGVREVLHGLMGRVDVDASQDPDGELYIETDETVGQYNEQWFYLKPEHVVKVMPMPVFNGAADALKWLEADD